MWIFLLTSCEEALEINQEWNETKMEFSETVQEIKNFNPVSEITNEITETKQEITQTIDEVKNFDVSAAVSNEINEVKQEISENFSVDAVVSEILN